MTSEDELARAIAAADQRSASARDFGMECAAFQNGYEDGRLLPVLPEQRHEFAGVIHEDAIHLTHAFLTLMLTGVHPAAFEDDDSYGGSE